jgi:two-component system chemotaxis response regulator CheY
MPEARGRLSACPIRVRDSALADAGLLSAQPAAVLVVEDDPSIREMMVLMLGLEAFAPIPAANAADALAVLRSGASVRVILLDLMMPVMDGWAFLEAQHADARLASIPVVVTTAERPGATRELRADAVFLKPIDFGRLIACVRDLAEHGRQAPSP